MEPHSQEEMLVFVNPDFAVAKSARGTAAPQLVATCGVTLAIRRFAFDFFNFIFLRRKKHSYAKFGLKLRQGLSKRLSTRRTAL